MTLPLSLPSTTISRALMLALTTPFLPTVTRLPGMLMLPSTLPSMNSDSVPVISPLMERPLLIEACSPAGEADEDWVARGVSMDWLHGGGANWLWGRIRGRLALLGRFPHSAQSNFLFCPFRTRVPRQGPPRWTRNSKIAEQRALYLQGEDARSQYEISPARALPSMVVAVIVSRVGESLRMCRVRRSRRPRV